MPECRTMHERVEARVREHPDRIAVVDGPARITYSDLWRESRHIVGLLAGAGVPAGGLVGLRVPRTWRTIAAILAVWRHGCGYVPVDEAAPAARQRHILRHAGLTHVLVDGDGGHRVEAAGQGTAHPVPDDVAYVVFTSGSTGAAKGVVITHRNIGALVDSATYLGGDLGGVWSQAHTHNFDFSVWEMWVPLISGGVCVLVPGDVVADGSAFAEVLCRERVTVLNIVPSVFRRLLSAAVDNDIRLPDLRRVIFGGEAINPDDVRRWWDSSTADRATVHNMYGVTECTVHVTTHQLTGTSMAAVAPGTPIGEPLPHLRAELVDGDRSVPAGEPGELYVAGAGVAHGYLGRDDLTAHRFVDLDLGGGACTWYRTGDLACRSPDGGLVYLGRVDDQVKIRGIRVEPAETERALRGHPAVDRAAVVAVRDRAGEPALAAAVLADEDIGPVPAAELRGHVLGLLPPAFVPTAVRWVDRWPTTESGKLDRAALVTLLTADTTADTAIVDELAGLWTAATAGDMEAGEDGGFLSLGGHSLSALWFTGEVAARYGVRLPVASLLRDNASLADVRTWLAAHEPDRPEWTQPHQEPAGSWPLAPGQRRIWLQDQLNPHAAAYNVLTVVHCPGAHDSERAGRALVAAVTRHPALLARLRELESGSPRWFPDTTTAVPVEHLRVASTDAVPSCAAEFSARPFDLRHDLPVRLAVVEAPDAPGVYLVICLHHIVSDQRSVEILLADFAHIHNAGTDAALATPQLPGETPVDPDAADADLRYWTDLLRDAPQEAALPFRTGIGPGGPDGHLARVTLDPDRSADLDALAASTPTTAFIAFAAALGALLAEWCGQETLVFGAPSSRRRTAAQDREVGFLLDTLPIRVDVPRSVTFRELLGQVRDRFVAAVEHSSVPFDELVSALGRNTALGRHPVFNVWLNDLTRNAEPPTVGGVSTHVLDPAAPRALFDLNLYLYKRDGAYQVDVIGAAGRVPGTVVDALAQQLRHLLTAACASPDVPVCTVDLAPLPGPPAPNHPVPEQDRLTVHQLTTALLADARTRGQAPAIETPGGMLGYAELADRVARLAAELRTAGAGPGAAVELVATRAAALLVALLACWAVGAVPCLVDARWPDGQRRAVRHRIDPCCVVCPDLTVHHQDGGRELPGAGYVLFTSGTSGEPAAVLAGETALPAAMSWYRAEFQLSPTDRVALLSGPAHDPVLRDVLAPLLAGGTCVVPPEDATATPAVLATFLHTSRTTVLHTTPPLLRLLLAALHDQPRRLDALRLVVSGGAPLTADLVRGLRRFSTAAVVNAYGLTESPQIAVWHPVTDLDSATIPIGSAVLGGQLLVRTPDGRPAAIGQRGELVLRGGRLALGYLDGTGRDGVFGTDASGAPVLHTGDLARIHPDGLVHLDGRADRQVQMHGFRIELTSVEAAATRHPLVDHAVAQLRTEGGQAKLELDVLASGALEPADVLRHLRTALPPHAIPSAIRITDRIALDHNSKTALPQHITPAPGDASHVDSPLTEPVLIAVREVLGRDIPVTQNFFDAGLASMSLLELRTVLERRLDRPVPVTDLFEHTTIRALAARLALPPSIPERPTGSPRRNPAVPAGTYRRRRATRRGALLAIGRRHDA